MRYQQVNYTLSQGLITSSCFSTNIIENTTYASETSSLVLDTASDPRMCLLSLSLASFMRLKCCQCIYCMQHYISNGYCKQTVAVITQALIRNRESFLQFLYNGRVNLLLYNDTESA